MRYQARGEEGGEGREGRAEPGSRGGAAMLGRLFQGKGRAAGGFAGSSSEGGMEGFGSAPQTSGVRSPPPHTPPAPLEPPPPAPAPARAAAHAPSSPFASAPLGASSPLREHQQPCGCGCPPGGVGEGGRGRGARRLHTTTGGRSRGPVAARRRSLCAVRARAGEGRADNLNYSCFPRHRSKLRSSRQKLN